MDKPEPNRMYSVPDDASTLFGAPHASGRLSSRKGGGKIMPDGRLPMRLSPIGWFAVLGVAAVAIGATIAFAV
jgi:hypothetical protein